MAFSTWKPIVPEKHDNGITEALAVPGGAIVRSRNIDLDQISESMVFIPGVRLVAMRDCYCLLREE